MKWFMAGCLTALVFAPASVFAQHEDIAPYGEGGKIVTGGRIHGSSSPNEYQQVFGYDFGEEPLDPFVIEDPGINNDADVAAAFLSSFGKNPVLPVGAILKFNILDTMGSKLLFWDGSGAVDFAPAPLSTELGIKKGSFEAKLSSSAVTGTTPAIATVDASGRVHEHLGSILYQDGDSAPGGPDAPDGIYLFGMSLFLTGGASALDPSDPLYIVYLNNVGETLGDEIEAESIHDLASDWVQTNLVPEPSSLAHTGSALLGLIGIARRRQRNG